MYSSKKHKKTNQTTDDTGLQVGVGMLFKQLSIAVFLKHSRYRKVRVSIGRPIFGFWPCITFSLQGQTKFVILNLSSFQNRAIMSCLNNISAPTGTSVSSAVWLIFPCFLVE